jgi:hypothetical protein
MSRKRINTAILTAALLLVVAQGAFASFTGSSDDRINRFSLKNLNKYTKSYSLTGLRPSAFQFRGSQDLDLLKTDNSLEINSMIRLERGNTTYIFPYKYKVKVPKFKTPSPTFR